MKYPFAFIILAFMFTGCSRFGLPSIYSDYTHADPQYLKIYFQFGFRDRLDTFERILQKDLVVDGIATTPFWFTTAEQDSIYNLIGKIDFFNLPDIFISRSVVVTPDPGDRYLLILYGTKHKLIRWSYQTSPDNPDYKKFLQLHDYIIKLIESKPAYQRLPKSKGFYL